MTRSAPGRGTYTGRNGTRGARGAMSGLRDMHLKGNVLEMTKLREVMRRFRVTKKPREVGARP